jgi:uncharacterized protein YndB with AHSA1/START domain
MKIVDIDLRVGGTWRYVMIAHSEHEVAFHGEYREIVPDERIVTTEVYEGAPPPPEGEDVLNVITFTEADGRTLVELLVKTPSREVRDVIVNSGMELGLQEQMEILDEVLVSLG